MKHTPGPWTIIDQSDGEVLTIQPMSAQLIVYDSTNVEQNRANAILITSAPELLEALVFLVDCFKGEHNKLGPVQLDGLTKAFKAINKAKL